MNCFELCGIDAPLIEGYLQPVEDGWHCMVDVSAFIAANKSAGPVDQCQVFLEVEQNSSLGNRWTQSSVRTIRTKHDIKPAPEQTDDGILNLVQAKRYSGVSGSTILRLINANILPAKQVAPFAPYEIKRSDLDTEPVSSMLKTLKKTGELTLKGGVSDNQSELFV